MSVVHFGIPFDDGDRAGFLREGVWLAGGDGAGHGRHVGHVRAENIENALDAVKDAGGNTVSERQPIGDMTPPPTSPTPNAT
jgi:hypothetical protein